MNDLQRSLLRRNRVFITDMINTDTYMYLREAVATKIGEGCPPLFVHISSSGGHVGPGLDVYDLIRYYPGKTIGVVHSMAGSMGAFILQACDWRVATPNAEVLVHHMSDRVLTLDIVSCQEQRDRFIHNLELGQQRIYEILLSRTSRSIDEVKAMCTAGTSLEAEKALEYGLIDQVIVNEDDIRFPGQ